MKKKLAWLAILILPGGFIIFIFRFWRHGVRKLIKIFSSIKNKIFKQN